MKHWRTQALRPKVLLSYIRLSICQDLHWTTGFSSLQLNPMADLKNTVGMELLRTSLDKGMIKASPQRHYEAVVTADWWTHATVMH
jgi:hypothetical protein